MEIKKFSFFILFSFFFILSLSAQEKTRNDIFVSPIAEALGFGWNGIAFGGGVAIGAGTGGTLGLKLLYAVDDEQISFLEANVFARYYIFGKTAFYGPFIQANAGPVIYTDANIDPVKRGYGNISAGVTTGWRFTIGKYFFIEPSLRIGYPYLAGGGIALGFRQ